jgi:hypothetical protein
MIITDITNYLLTTGGLTDVYAGDMPDQPDAAICVKAYGGEAPDEDLGVEYPKIQIEVRDAKDTNAQVTYTRAYNAMKLLYSLRAVVIGTTHYYYIKADNGPNPIGRDAKGRMGYTVNFSVFKEME